MVLARLEDRRWLAATFPAAAPILTAGVVLDAGDTLQGSGEAALTQGARVRESFFPPPGSKPYIVSTFPE